MAKLDNLIPPFETLFHVENQIAIIDSTDGVYYYGAKNIPEDLSVFAPIALNDGTEIGFVGIYSELSQSQAEQVVHYLAGTLSTVATEVWRSQKLSDEVLERYDELNLIYDLGLLISDQGLSQDEIVKVVLEQTNRIIKAGSGVIYLYNADQSDLVPVSFFGQYTDIDFWRGRNREFAQSTLHAYDNTQLSQGGTVICVPLRHREERLGALVLMHDDGSKQFSASDVNLLSTLTHNTALFIQAARLYDQILDKNQDLELTLTELKSAREELSRTERLSIIGQTVSGLVHDMRNPLSIIMGYAGLLEEGGVSDLETREYASQIIQYVNVFSAMAEEVLDYTRSDENINLKRTPVDAYLETIENLLSPPGLKRTVRIIVNKEKVRGYFVNIDGQRYARVFQNLVNNGVDAIEEHGGSEVVIDAVPLKKGMIRFTVTDDGPGIPPEIVQRIFEPFFTGKSRGTGLGLPIVNRVIMRHGGEIHYEKAPNGGACFIFTLPIA